MMAWISRGAMIGFAFSAILGGCTDKVAGPAPITTADMGVSDVTISPASVVVLVGSSSKLTGTVDAPPYITDRRIIWSSSDSTVATIDAAGVVTAIKHGTATIIAAAATEPTVKARATVSSVDALTVGSP
jgi:uncharacterized protein YjdB